MKATIEILKTREFGTKSSFRLIDNRNYTKEVHVNGNTAALVWKVDNKPMLLSKYYPLNNLPEFIKRNVKFHEYHGEIEVLEINNNSVLVKTDEEKKWLHICFFENICNSINECMNSNQKQRHCLDDIIEHTEKEIDVLTDF